LKADVLEPTAVEEYLVARLPDREGLRLAGLRRVPGGMSRQTWFADVEWSPEEPRRERLTLRADYPHGSVTGIPLRYEFDVMRGLYRSEIPVAEVFWFEDDERWFGRPLYVRECVAGDASPRKLFAPDNAAAKERIGRRLVELLADIHTFDWQTRRFGDFMAVPREPREAALLEVARWRRHLAATAVEPRPVAAELFAWLERNAPATVQRISLVWGDVGVGNFIYRDDQILALTDWEQAHLGDPMKDIAAALWRGIESLVPRDDFFSIYEERSGLRIDQAAIDYYTLFIDAQNASSTGSVWRHFTDDSVIDISFAWMTYGIGHRCLDHGLAAVMASDA
jgi:aminoglycoside phosphotransferase (APT) family kinase protein